MKTWSGYVHGWGKVKLVLHDTGFLTAECEGHDMLHDNAGVICALKEAFRTGLAFTEVPPEKFMVYRDGGRSPVFKHDDIGSAKLEARRVANVSGCKTYVVGVVETCVPNSRPTDQEFESHIARYGRVTHENNAVGFWRVIWDDADRPFIVGTWKQDGRVATSLVPPPEARWFPLDSEGREVREEDIPI